MGRGAQARPGTAAGSLPAEAMKTILGLESQSGSTEGVGIEPPSPAPLPPVALPPGDRRPDRR